MAVLKKIYKSIDPITLTIDLRSYGKTAADISDVFFSLKVNPDSDADDSLFLKQKTVASGIEISGTDFITAKIKFVAADWSNLVAEAKYPAALGIKWNGETVIDENFDQRFTLEILPDFYRE